MKPRIIKTIPVKGDCHHLGDFGNIFDVDTRLWQSQFKDINILLVEYKGSYFIYAPQNIIFSDGPPSVSHIVFDATGNLYTVPHISFPYKNIPVPQKQI